MPLIFGITYWESNISNKTFLFNNNHMENSNEEKIIGLIIDKKMEF